MNLSHGPCNISHKLCVICNVVISLCHELLLYILKNHPFIFHFLNQSIKRIIHDEKSGTNKICSIRLFDSNIYHSVYTILDTILSLGLINNKRNKILNGRSTVNWVTAATYFRPRTVHLALYS